MDILLKLKISNAKLQFLVINFMAIVSSIQEVTEESTGAKWNIGILGGNGHANTISKMGYYTYVVLAVNNISFT